MRWRMRRDRFRVRDYEPLILLSIVMVNIKLVDLRCKLWCWFVLLSQF
jgi:hypothetical protein